MIPSTGGVPRQLTFYPARGPLPPRWGYDNQVYGWTPRRQVRPLPLACATAGTCRHAPLHRAGRRRAGRAAADAGLRRRRPLAGRQADGLLPARPRLPHLEALPGRLGAGPLHLRPRDPRCDQNITDDPRTDRDPMWIGDKIYFASDRTGTLNLYAYDVASGKTVTQLTRSDAAGTCAGRARTRTGEIVYELGGELQRLRHAQRPERGDRDQRARRRPLPTGRRSIAAAEPDRGLRAVAQGRAGAVRGARRRLHGADREGRRRATSPAPRARTTRARAGRRTARKIAFISDRTGEEEIWLVDQDGTGKPRSSSPAAARRCATRRPGRRTASALAFSDKDGKLWVLTLAGRQAGRGGATRRAASIPTTPGRPTARTSPSAARATNELAARSGSGASPTAKLRRVTGRAVRRDRPGLGSRRQVPLLPQRPRVRAAVRRRRVQLRHRPHDRHLRPGPAQGRRATPSRPRATR